MQLKQVLGSTTSYVWPPMAAKVGDWLLGSYLWVQVKGTHLSPSNTSNNTFRFWLQLQTHGYRAVTRQGQAVLVLNPICSNTSAEPNIMCRNGQKTLKNAKIHFQRPCLGFVHGQRWPLVIMQHQEHAREQRGVIDAVSTGGSMMAESAEFSQHKQTCPSNQASNSMLLGSGMRINTVCYIPYSIVELHGRNAPLSTFACPSEYLAVRPHHMTSKLRTVHHVTGVAASVQPWTQILREGQHGQAILVVEPTLWVIFVLVP